MLSEERRGTGIVARKRRLLLHRESWLCRLLATCSHLLLKPLAHAALHLLHHLVWLRGLLVPGLEHVCLGHIITRNRLPWIRHKLLLSCVVGSKVAHLLSRHLGLVAYGRLRHKPANFGGLRSLRRRLGWCLLEVEGSGLDRLRVTLWKVGEEVLAGGFQILTRSRSWDS